MVPRGRRRRSVAQGGRGRGLGVRVQQHGRGKGSATDFCGQLERRWAAGVRSAAVAAALRRPCITGHRINPKPRRTRPAPQAAESVVHGAPCSFSAFHSLSLSRSLYLRHHHRRSATISAIIVHGSSRSTRADSLSWFPNISLYLSIHPSISFSLFSAECLLLGVRCAFLLVLLGNERLAAIRETAQQ